MTTIIITLALLAWYVYWDGRRDKWSEDPAGHWPNAGKRYWFWTWGLRKFSPDEKWRHWSPKKGLNPPPRFQKHLDLDGFHTAKRLSFYPPNLVGAYIILSEVYPMIGWKWTVATLVALLVAGKVVWALGARGARWQDMESDYK